MAHQARKRFGQHFLQDLTVINKIVHAIAPQLDDQVVEIGPGTGVLTKALLPELKHLTVVELDRDLIPILQTNCNTNDQLTIYQADVLDFDFRTLINSDKKLRVVGNLPYNITTPLLFHLLEQQEIIQDMHFMLQKEVAERLQAGPGTHAYGRLSIMVQYHCAVSLLFSVPPSAFNPPPQVQSAVIRLIPHAKIPFVANNYALFAKIVVTAFNQRRKTLRNSLQTIVNSEQLIALGIDPQKRAGDISIEEYVHLANVIAKDINLST